MEERKEIEEGERRDRLAKLISFKIFRKKKLSKQKNEVHSPRCPHSKYTCFLQRDWIQKKRHPFSALVEMRSSRLRVSACHSRAQI